MEYFYPLKDREIARDQLENRLELIIGKVVSSDGPFDDIDALYAKLDEAKSTGTRHE